MGMTWFIFTEAMFFAVFFSALFYARQLALPWLGGQGTDFWTNVLLWPGFENEWPSNGPADIGGDFTAMGAWGIPTLNTVLLLTSGATVTVAHDALRSGHRGVVKLFLFLTFALGFIFLGCQAYEYRHALTELNLGLGSGIYGTTFYMLTGFHGLHVTLGAIMLVVIWLRCLRGHFTAQQHFAFEAVAWYWHFVDVVWLGLFIFVYWL
jgi:cytochrome c oxidase subunit 3